MDSTKTVLAKVTTNVEPALKPLVPQETLNTPAAVRYVCAMQSRLARAGY